jgi:signal peptidase II
VSGKTSGDPTPAAADAAAPSRAARLALAGAFVVVALALDLATKAWAWERLRDSRGIRVIDRFFHLEFAFNTGSAFGLLREQSWGRAFFIVVTVLALAYVARLVATLPRRHALPFAALGLVGAGALGNLHDRIFREIATYGQAPRHGVVDFIVVYYWPNRRWPAFNIADAVLVVGVALFVLWMRKHGDAVAPARREP